MATTYSVIVIGAGISGLACAHALKKRNVDVVVLESNDSPGGMIRSVEENGYLFEIGPQSFSTTPTLAALFDDLKVSAELVAAPSRAPRYILINGKLREVPLSPPAFLVSPLLSWSTKFSLLREPFSKTIPPPDDESIAAFVRRKFTNELLELFAGPFVSGIYAGDPGKLSLRAAFPQLHEAEKQSGSIIRGMKRAEKTKPISNQKPTLASFRAGNEVLPRALAQALGNTLRTRTQVTQIARSASQQFEITAATGSGTIQFRTSHLVLATPTQAAVSLLQDLTPALTDSLAQIEYAPVAVVSLAYRRPDVAHSMNGFGFLIPRSARLKTLGTVWNSSLFPNRAPEGHVLLTSFLGGATDPATAALSSSSLLELAHSELAPLLGLKSLPAASRITAYKHAIPQYNLGHTARLAIVESGVAKIPGLHLTGNYFSGPAIGACVEHAQSVAESIRIG